MVTILNNVVRCVKKKQPFRYLDWMWIFFTF